MSNEWAEKKFIPLVQNRGSEIIELRGASSAASAGNAAMEHIRDWVYGTKGKWTNMAIISDGEYGVPEGLCFSYPVICRHGWYKVVEGLSFNEAGFRRFKNTIKELKQERDTVAHLLGPN